MFEFVTPREFQVRPGLAALFKAFEGGRIAFQIPRIWNAALQILRIWNRRDHGVPHLHETGKMWDTQPWDTQNPSGYLNYCILASPSAPRQEVKNRARWVGRNKRRRALGAGSSRILRHPRTLRRGVEHRRAAASAAGANELRVGRTAASPARRRARRPNTRERKKQLFTTT